MIIDKRSLCFSPNRARVIFAVGWSEFTIIYPVKRDMQPAESDDELYAAHTALDNALRLALCHTILFKIYGTGVFVETIG